MERLYQKEWFGIPFKTFSTIDSRCMATMSFYDKFYSEFYKRYSSYDDLPGIYKQKKGLVADYLLSQTNENMKILSIGCGIGYIENILKSKGRNIVAIEPSYQATRFLRNSSEVKIINGYFPQCLGDSERYDLIYCVDTDYVFDRDALISLIKNAQERANVFVIVGIYAKETLIGKLKALTKTMLSCLGLYDMGQFWGYLRGPGDLTRCFKCAGYARPEIGFINSSSFWIKANIK